MIFQQHLHPHLLRSRRAQRLTPLLYQYNPIRHDTRTTCAGATLHSCSISAHVRVPQSGSTCRLKSCFHTHAALVQHHGPPSHCLDETAVHVMLTPSNAALMQPQRTRSCAAVRLHMPASIVLPHARCTRAAARHTVALSR